ncbi:MAG: SDR family oxidoreductase [Oscillibacter sp.]|jgi:3-oxoacyl-[acyl-carrier protein] reductase|nr:SDR family oxidoreductase [Oscillibacter sp.]
MNSLKGKTAVVTGATSGIGAACARRFAEAGAFVILSGRNAERGAAAERSILDFGGQAKFIPVDVSDDGSIHDWAVKLGTYGRIDILFNNAGVYPMFQKLGALTREDWDQVFGVNCTGLVMVTQAVIPFFPEKGGVILNNASVAGMQSFASGQGYAYAASKSAVIQFTRMMAKVYGERMRVNCICPGVIETPLYESFDPEKFSEKIPMKRVGRPEDIARAANFLVSEDAGYINGAVIPVDGGLTV